jgi:RNA polymerase sigma-70 factor (ECF subfamily)
MTHAAATTSDLPALLARAAAGGEDAWAELLRRYARRVFAMARSRVKDPDTAQDITNAVFATIATKLASGQYEEQGRFEPWLFRVTMNRVRDEARRARRHATPTEPSTLAELRLATDDAPAADAEQLAALRGALDRLGDADRTVVELRHHAGMSFQQIADTLDEPIGTVLARHHRALKKLRSFLEPDGETAP